MSLNLYVINLAHRKDRLKHIREHLPVVFIRIEAIDKSEISFMDSILNLADSATSACWLSHQLAWKTAMGNNDEYCLILEDDALLLEGFDIENIMLSSAKFMSLKGIELLQLGFFQEIGRKRKLLRKFGFYNTQIERDFLKGALANRHGIGTHAYMISKSGAEKLSQVNNPVFLAADAALMYLAASQSKTQRIAIWQLRNSIFAQLPISETNKSDIQ
jgi:GR25 family glycosyltransferase involved in LPS biosynthesis